jgi:dipeptidyl aminopeptidase/acylaminoacyl peptidase
MWLVGLDGSDDREILNFGDDVKTSAAWFPDSRRILVDAETPTYRRIGIWEMGNAPNEVRWLVDDPTRNIEYAWVPHNGEQAILYEIQDTYVRCSLLDPDDGSEFQLPKLPGNLSLVGPVGEREWIGVYSNSRQPVDLVRFSLDDITPDRFTSIARIWDQTELTPEDLTRAEDYRWNSRDGLSIQGWLYRTAQTPSRGTIVYVHGGPTWHSRDQINPQIQYFVRQGFNVLDPNYRGSTGFNLAFREKIKVDGWGGMEQTDIATGIERLIVDGIAESGKIGITGTSYGGYSSWCAITHWPRTLVAAAAPICGMTDLVVDYKTTRPDLRPYSEEMMGGSPQDVPEKYKARSPIHFVQNIEGRLLIVQGMRDPNVTPENVSEVTRALQANGIEYELLAFEDEGHGISRRDNRKKLYQELLTFFSDAFGLAD